MPSLVVVGAQWGDEGKGKIVDVLTGRADWVVRFQGGSNAGHTIVVDGVKTALSLLPSGVLRPHSKCLLGAGVVINTSTLIAEMERVRAAGHDLGPERLLIDRDAHLVLEYHMLIDRERERRLGRSRIGTTGRGIGPAYEDRSQRSGLQFDDLRFPARLKERLREQVEEKNQILKYVLESDAQLDFVTIWDRLEQEAGILAPYVANGSLMLYDALQRRERIVFEGAQGVLLDQSHGTYPFVTSSSTIAGAVLTGCGLGPRTIDYVIGVAKAYCTRVGEGPFPSEMEATLAESVRERGHEFGTVTGRARRCGWFDVVGMKRAVRISGIDSLVITKLDIFSGLDTVKICTAYRKNGELLDDLPASPHEFHDIEPEFLEFPAWPDSISAARRWEDLPPAAKKLIERISQLVGCPVSMVSVGPGREATIGLDLPPLVRDFIAS